MSKADNSLYILKCRISPYLRKSKPWNPEVLGYNIPQFQLPRFSNSLYFQITYILSKTKNTLSRNLFRRSFVHKYKSANLGNLGEDDIEDKQKCPSVLVCVHENGQIWRFFQNFANLFYMWIDPEHISIRGCSHITSAKTRGSYTPPPPSVSNGQHLADPPSPLRQQWLAFSLPLVSIFPPALWYYNFRRRLFDMIKWGIFIC